MRVSNRIIPPSGFWLKLRPLGPPAEAGAAAAAAPTCGMASWACSRCTFLHEGQEASRSACAMCGAHRGAASPTSACAAAAAGAAPPQPALAAPAQPAPPEPSERCRWLAAEGLRLEARAAASELRGCRAAEAGFQHRLAAAKVAEAAALCPEGHPDGLALVRYAREIASREVYLDSLGEAPISIPLEDYVGPAEELALRMDLSAGPPQEEEIRELLARGGASGETVELSEAGFQLVAALCRPDELARYARRTLEADGRQLRQGAAESALAAAAAPARSLVELQGALRSSPLVELSVDPGRDKLELAVLFEQEARRLEGEARRSEAADMCRTYIYICLSIYLSISLSLYIYIYMFIYLSLSLSI